MAWLISLLMAGTLFSSGTVPSLSTEEFTRPPLAVQKDETERISETYDFSPNGRIEVNNINGSITIDTWDEPKIKLEVIKTADSRERLAELKIEIEARQDSFRVSAEIDRSKGNIKWERGSSLNADIRLTVPRNAVLNEIHTVNGSVSISDSRSSVNASAVNGQVKAVNLQGNAELSTVNGTIDAEYGKLFPGNMIALDTVNGSVNLTIPSDSNATVRAESLNGEIKNDFGLTVKKGEWVGRDLYGKIGTGEVKIKMESVNGTLSIKRLNDGKTLNPAVNLLSSKDRAGSGSDFDNDFEAARREADREMRNARRDLDRARRELETSMRAARIDAETRESVKKSVEALQPEIAKVTKEALIHAEKALELAREQSKTEIAKRLLETKAVVADPRFQWRTPFVEEKTGSFPVKNNLTLKLETSNCDIVIRGWEKSEVKYSMSKFAANISQLPIEFSAVQTASSSVDIKVINANEPAGARLLGPDLVRVRVEIFVPNKTDLSIVTDSEVRIDGVTGKIDLTGEDGDVNIRDSAGKLDLKVQDPTVRVIGFRGEVVSSANDGNLFLEGDVEKLTVKLEDGNFFLTVPEGTGADITSNTTISTSVGVSLIENGMVDDSTNRWRLGKGGRAYAFTVGNGSVVIKNQKVFAVLK